MLIENNGNPAGNCFPNNHVGNVSSNVTRKNEARVTSSNPLNEMGKRIDEILESGALDSLLKSITMERRAFGYAPWQMRSIVAGDHSLDTMVTELVDNSNDAGASNISIVLSDRGPHKKKNAGGENDVFSKSIVVIDDGRGFDERGLGRWVFEIETSEGNEKRSRSSVGHFGLGSTRLSWVSERTLLVTRSQESDVQMALRDKNMGTVKITGENLQRIKALLNIADDFQGTIVFYLGVETDEKCRWLGKLKTEALRKTLESRLGLRYGHILPGYRDGQPKTIRIGIVGNRCVTEKTEKGEDARKWDISALDYLLMTPKDIKDGYVPSDEVHEGFFIDTIRIGTFHAVLHNKDSVISKDLNKATAPYNFAMSSEKTHFTYRGVHIGEFTGIGTGKVHNNKNYTRVVVELDDDLPIDHLARLGISFKSDKVNLQIADAVKEEIRETCDIFVKRWSLKSAKQGTNSKNQELEKAKQRTGDFKKRSTSSVVGHDVAGHTRSLNQGQFGIDSLENPPSLEWNRHLQSKWKNLGAMNVQGNPFDLTKIGRDDVIDDHPYFGPGLTFRDGSSARFDQLLRMMRYNTTLKTSEVDDDEVKALEYEFGSMLQTVFHTVHDSLRDEARPLCELIISQVMNEIFKITAYLNKHDSAATKK